MFLKEELPGIQRLIFNYIKMVLIHGDILIQTGIQKLLNVFHNNVMPMYLQAVELKLLKYFVSVGTNYQDAIYKNSATNYGQANFRSNIDAKISKNVRLSFDISGRQENRNYPTRSSGDIFSFLIKGKPILPAYWPNGLPGPDIEYGDNPVVIVTDQTGYDNDKRYYAESNIKLDITIPWVKGLTVTSNASIDKNFRDRKLWQKPWYLYFLGLQIL